MFNRSYNKADWIWMPHPGHLIVSHECRFHLNTFVPSNRNRPGYIISTVGEWWPNRISQEIHAKIYDETWFEENKGLKGDYWDAAYMNKFGYHEIGYNCKYETMVFTAVPEINATQLCCPYRQNQDQGDDESYNDAVSAYNGHMQKCAKWSRR